MATSESNTTSYNIVFQKFYRKLVNDKKFFSYQGLTVGDIELLVKDHTLALMDEAIDMIYEIGNPKINFYDKDDENAIFNNKLLSQEIALLANIMFYKKMNEFKNTIDCISPMFTNKELNALSPANERNSKLKLILNEKNEVKVKITNYLARDRTSWEYNSIYKGD